MSRRSKNNRLPIDARFVLGTSRAVYNGNLPALPEKVRKAVPAAANDNEPSDEARLLDWIECVISSNGVRRYVETYAVASAAMRASLTNERPDRVLLTASLAAAGVRHFVAYAWVWARFSHVDPFIGSRLPWGTHSDREVYAVLGAIPERLHRNAAPYLFGLGLLVAHADGRTGLEAIRHTHDLLASGYYFDP